MKQPIVVQDSEHAAFLHADQTVSVYRLAGHGTLVPMGTGRWEGGIILGSGVNCGILVRLEPALRAATGTP